MFDVGFWELALIAVIGLIILGPERLPRAARTVGLWMGKARRMVADVKSDIDREIDAQELRELKKVGDEIKDTGRMFKDAASTLNESVDPSGDTAAPDASRDPPAEPVAGEAADKAGSAKTGSVDA